MFFVPATFRNRENAEANATKMEPATKVWYVKTMFV